MPQYYLNLTEGITRHDHSGLAMILLQLRIFNARNFKAIGGATVNRRRTKSSDRHKMIDAKSRINEMVRDVKHDHFTNK